MGVYAGLTRGVCDVEPLRDRLVCAYALIATIEGITDRERHADLPAPGGLGTIESFAIEYQADVPRGALPGQGREYLLRVRHLRDLRGIDEAGGFNALEPRGREPGDELNLDRRRENSGLVLQSIARSHLHYFDRFPRCGAALPRDGQRELYRATPRRTNQWCTCPASRRRIS